MRYPFRTVLGTPALQPVNIGITLATAAPADVGGAAADAAPPTSTAELSIVAASPTCAAPIGGAAVSIVLTLTNNGSSAANGAVVTAPWLADTIARTLGTLTATPSTGVTLGAFAKANLITGATVNVWPAGGTIGIAVDVTAVAAFVESFVTRVVPAVGVAELSPADNTSVITAQGATAAAIAWQDFVTPSLHAASITAGVQDYGGGSIAFCGDGYTQRATGGGGWAAALSCPPSGPNSGARWQIQLLTYNPASTYTVVQDYSALSPPPATYTATFAVTQSADLLTITTGYTLLGATVADGIASAGNALFEVFENGVSIGTVTLVLVMY